MKEILVRNSDGQAVVLGESSEDSSFDRLFATYNVAEGRLKGGGHETKSR